MWLNVTILNSPYDKKLVNMEAKGMQILFGFK